MQILHEVQIFILFSNISFSVFINSSSSFIRWTSIFLGNRLNSVFNAISFEENVIYDKTQLDENCVRIAFSVAKKLKAQSIAFDFIYDQERNPLIVEISYGYAIKAYYDCEGYWTDDMIWHSGSHFDIEGWILEGVINGIK